MTWRDFNSTVKSSGGLTSLCLKCSRLTLLEKLLAPCILGPSGLAKIKKFLIGKTGSRNFSIFQAIFSINRLALVTNRE